MNVRELREMLQEMEDEGHADKEVLFAYNYGDHWRTEVAAMVDTCEEGTVKYSSYHSMDKVVDSDDEEGGEEEGCRQVVILG